MLYVMSMIFYICYTAAIANVLKLIICLVVHDIVYVDYVSVDNLLCAMPLRMINFMFVLISCICLYLCEANLIHTFMRSIRSVI
jgi:hypothetical protein